jgi:hypothetical protein
MAVQTSMFPQQQLHCNIETVFSVLSVPKGYKQDKLGVAVSWITTGLQSL